MPQRERVSQHHEPEFDGGSFTIDFLSDSPEGFVFKTRESLRRRQGKYGLRPTPPGGLEPLPLTSDHKEKIMQGMMRERSMAEQKSQAKGISYTEAFRDSQKVGLRNIKLDGNVLSADTVQVPFPFYRNINKPSETAESLELATHIATAMILETADNKLIVQHRSANNALYKDIPGASAAGQFDKPEGPHEPGTLPEITTDSIKDNALAEMKQEIGLDLEDIGDLRLTGLATDKVAVHNEFLLFARSNLTAAQIEQKAEENAKNKDKEGYDFDEKFFVISGDPDSIRKLLTDVKCPLPSTHTAAFIAAWYSQMLERFSTSEARLNLKHLEEDVKRNYQVIDMLARANNPESSGFDPAKTPQEQGLPDILSEFKRTGLI